MPEENLDGPVTLCGPERVIVAIKVDPIASQSAPSAVGAPFCESLCSVEEVRAQGRAGHRVGEPHMQRREASCDRLQSKLGDELRASAEPTRSSGRGLPSRAVSSRWLFRLGSVGMLLFLIWSWQSERASKLRHTLVSMHARSKPKVKPRQPTQLTHSLRMARSVRYCPTPTSLLWGFPL